MMPPIVPPVHCTIMKIPIHHPRSWRKKRSATIALANASVVLPANAPRIRAAIKLSKDWAAPLQIVVAKKIPVAIMNTGRRPIYIANGIQKKFYRQLKILYSGRYRQTNCQDGPADDPMHGLIEIGAKLVHEEDHGGTDTTENPHDEKGEHTRCAKGKCLFPMWPVERVVDII